MKNIFSSKFYTIILNEFFLKKKKHWKLILKTKNKKFNLIRKETRNK